MPDGEKLPRFMVKTELDNRIYQQQAKNDLICINCECSFLPGMIKSCKLAIPLTNLVHVSGLLND